MPLYRFKCDKCDTTIEEFFKISESESTLKCTSKLDCDGTCVRDYGLDFKQGSMFIDPSHANTGIYKKK